MSRNSARTSLIAAVGCTLFRSRTRCRPLNALLFRRLHRHETNCSAAIRFRRAGRIGAIGLVAEHVWTHRVCGQQRHRVTTMPESARPIVHGAARLHDEAKRRCIVEGAGEAWRLKRRGSTSRPCASAKVGSNTSLARSIATVAIDSESGVACMTDSSRDPVSGLV